MSQLGAAGVPQAIMSQLGAAGVPQAIMSQLGTAGVPQAIMSELGTAGVPQGGSQVSCPNYIASDKLYAENPKTLEDGIDLIRCHLAVTQFLFV